MNRAGLLQETTAWMDTVDLALCLFIYEQRLPVRVSVGQRLRELPEPETHRTGGHRAPEREPSHLLHGVFHRPYHQAARARETLVGRVPETLRHIQILLRHVCNNAATKENQDFRKSIDKAVENARRLKGTP